VLFRGLAERAARIGLGILAGLDIEPGRAAHWRRVRSHDLNQRSGVERFVLPLVSRPDRYVGSAQNRVPKDFDRAGLRIVLALGDAYEIGMSHTGLRILYHILNRRPGTLAEFCFAPWPDAERALRSRGLPLLSLESQRPLSDFDLVGFSLQYELHYTNILNMLDLGGVPLLARERGEDDPLIIGGGHAAYAPEPMADYFDAFVLGDGEEVVQRVAALTERWAGGEFARPELLRRLAAAGSIYVPAGYDLVESAQGYLVAQARPGWPASVQGAWVETLKPEYYPDKPLVPLAQITHDRLTVEVMRGCTRGCRFCQAGMINRPVRQKPPAQIVNEALTGLANTGWDEVSLMSLSTTDHTEIVAAVDQLVRDLCGVPVAISLPSTRPGTLPESLARTLGESKSGHLTLAPEAGSQRLRDVINKGVRDEELLESVSLAARQGYTGAKLYFMIGLPGERPEDLVGIADLSKRALAAGRQAARNGRFTVTLSLSPHVPKAQTPFQWEAQDASALIEEKVRLLRSRVRGTPLVLKWRDSETAFLEGVFSRGDRRLGPAVLEAWKRGCRFDGWTEHLRFATWTSVFADLGIDAARYLEARRDDVPQCWEHLRSPVSRGFLLKEREKARRAAVTVDCRLASCHACGIPDCPDRLSPTGRRPGDPETVPAPALVQGPGPAARRAAKLPIAASLAMAIRFRLRFLKGEALRFVAHLELLRVWERALRRSRLPVAMSQGFRPHIRMSFGPPLPLGQTSLAEYLDLEFARPPAADLLETLNPLLPEGLQVTGWRPILYRTASLMSALDTAAYRIRFTDAYLEEGGWTPAALEEKLSRAAAEILGRDQILVTRNGKDGPRTIDIRPSLEAVEPLASGQGLDFWIRMTPGCQARPEELLAQLLPGADPRLAAVERTGLWATAGDRRLDPFELLSSVAAPLPETSRAMG
jgi:radical SAM family uncharacterized protein/radical SAM-linked protein